MNILIDIIFRVIVVNYLGLYIRYFFFKIIRKKKTKKYLLGECTKDPIESFSQNVLNALVGMLVIALIAALIASL